MAQQHCPRVSRHDITTLPLSVHKRNLQTPHHIPCIHCQILTLWGLKVYKDWGPFIRKLHQKALSRSLFSLWLRAGTAHYFSGVLQHYANLTSVHFNPLTWYCSRVFHNLRTSRFLWRLQTGSPVWHPGTWGLAWRVWTALPGVAGRPRLETKNRQNIQNVATPEVLWQKAKKKQNKT